MCYLVPEYLDSKKIGKEVSMQKPFIQRETLSNKYGDQREYKKHDQKTNGHHLIDLKDQSIHLAIILNRLG